MDAVLKQEMEADEKLKWRREIDRAIQRGMEDGKAKFKEAARKERVDELLKCVEEIETTCRDYRCLVQRREDLRTEILTLTTQVGEKAAALEVLKTKKEELERE